MNWLLFMIIGCIPIVACAGTSRASDAKTNVQVGQCHFHLPKTSAGHFTVVQGGVVNLAYSYKDYGHIYQTNLNFHCSNMDLHRSISDNYKRSSNGLIFKTGSVGGSKTSEIERKHWHGLMTEYYLGSPCVYFIGTAGKSNSFNLTICDSEETLPPQLKALDTILSELETN